MAISARSCESSVSMHAGGLSWLVFVVKYLLEALLLLQLMLVLDILFVVLGGDDDSNLLLIEILAILPRLIALVDRNVGIFVVLLKFVQPLRAEAL